MSLPQHIYITGDVLFKVFLQWYRESVLKPDTFSTDYASTPPEEAAKEATEYFVQLLKEVQS